MKQGKPLLSRRIPHAFVLTILTSLAISTLATELPPQEKTPATDKTTVQVVDAGGGNKQELVRNAAGDVVEIRTYDSQGKLVSRQNTIYRPGYFSPDQITTTFYPDQKTIRTNAKVTYDPSANFLTELTEQFDQSGKHISGHKLLHDPITGMFRCWNWNAQSQKYDRVSCPSGEESGEKPLPMKPVTLEEATKMLQAARTAATAEQKSERMTPKNMVTPPVNPTETRVSIVLPANLGAGKQVSGSLQENPYLFRLRPDLIVEEVTLAMVPGSEAAKLSGWRVEVSGSQAQRADSPFTFTVPSAAQFEIKIYPDGDMAHAVTRTISVPKSPAKATKANSGYRAQALCVAEDVCPIGGVFSGNATTSFAAFDDKPASIAAETSDMVFVRVPDNPLLGENYLLFNEGNELLAFNVAIAQVDVVVDGRQLDTFQEHVNQGQNKLVFAGVIAVQTLPEEDWRAGMFPSSNLEWARRFAPGFQVPHESHAEREEREMMEKMAQKEKGIQPSGKEKEEKLGSIVYFVKNTTPDVVTWRGAKDGVVVLPLNPESFSQGDFRYKFVAEASKTGTYTMDAAVIPFIAPTQGQKFTLPATAGTH